MSLKTMCPNPGGLGEEFYSSGSREGWLMRIGVCGVHLASGGLLMGFCGSQGYLLSGMENASSSS